MAVHVTFLGRDYSWHRGAGEVIVDSYRIKHDLQN
jgi:hypothetical protein